MWTKKSYDALFLWLEGRREECKSILFADGLTGAIDRLEHATNMGVWYRLTREAARAVGNAITAQSAREAMQELESMVY